mgnify:CR=1 FL=1
MDKKRVSIIDYQRPYASVAEAVRRCGAESMLSCASSVFIKPNVVFWTRHTPFPKYGVITTSRVVEDMVVLLKDMGVKRIYIGEGGVTRRPGDTRTFAHAFEALGYLRLAKRYGVKVIQVLEEPFARCRLGKGISLNFNRQALESDLVISLPALKTHSQTVVSLGIKNLKGLIDMTSRKTCHNPDPEKDLHVHVAQLAKPFNQVFTLIDGIYSLERGPGFDGKMHRRNLLIGSTDPLAADKAGAVALGIEPSAVPYIVHAAEDQGRPLGLGDIDISGRPLDGRDWVHGHEFDFAEDGEKALPLPMAAKGMKGLFYRKYDDTMCTYCSAINGVVLSAVFKAWDGRGFDQVEVLTGKKMVPARGMNTTILLGKCMSRVHKDNPDIRRMIRVKGCPPDLKDIAAAFERAGVPVDTKMFEAVDMLPGTFLKRVKDRPGFDESFYEVRV